MNKLVKGSIAAAAGIALLLGGAGTLALWNSDATIAGATADSGVMTINTNGNAASDVVFNGGSSVTYAGPMVPGDVVTIDQPVIITATGQNLKASLTIDEVELLGDADLLAATTLDVKAYAGGTEVTGLSSLTAAQAETIDSVVVTITFDMATDGEVAQNQSIDLGSLKVVLQQIV